MITKWPRALLTCTRCTHAEISLEKVYHGVHILASYMTNWIKKITQMVRYSPSLECWWNKLRFILMSEENSLRNSSVNKCRNINWGNLYWALGSGWALCYLCNFTSTFVNTERVMLDTFILVTLQVNYTPTEYMLMITVVWWCDS